MKGSISLDLNENTTEKFNFTLMIKIIMKCSNCEAIDILIKMNKNRKTIEEVDNTTKERGIMTKLR